MDDASRPDPDKLLAAMTRAKERQRYGRLSIYFGMAAGVGKTTAMLEDAHQRRRDGVDVVIGVIHTHGRQEVARLSEGLERVSELEVVYRGSVFKEMNLNAILHRHPQLVLVDELPHTNVQGSRHPYRWQDVVDILHEGIDVYTTLNVQHVESRKELVEDITGVAIRETVPDSMIEMASEIKLVDVSPAQLLIRLREGKVYLGDKSHTAAAHFFQEDSLTALREIALRFTAEKVDHDLHELLVMRGDTETWRPTERLLVAVSHSPYAQQLIRTTRRLAYLFKAPWVALHIEDGKRLSPEAREMLSKNLLLARDLGAEVLTVSDSDIAAAVKRVAVAKHITQIILGRPPGTLLKRLLSSSHLLERAIYEVTDCDLFVARQEPIPASSRAPWSLELTSGAWSYVVVISAIALAAGLGVWLEPLVGYVSIGLLFLVVLMVCGLFFGKGPLLVGAVEAVLLWSSFFGPPALEFFMRSETALLTGLFFLAVGVDGILMNRIRTAERLLRQSEEQSSLFYDISREIGTAPTKSQLLQAVSERLGRALEGTVGIALTGARGELLVDAIHKVVLNDKERAVAVWVLRNGQPAGWSTDTLSSIGVLYLPLRGAKEILGVLAYRPTNQHVVSIEEMNLLRTLVQQLSYYLERSLYEERERKGEYQRRVNNLQRVILDSTSEELTVPLQDIHAAVLTLLGSSEISDEGKKEVRRIDQAVDDLRQGLGNLAELSRLSTGFLEAKKDFHSISDLVQSATQTISKRLEGHQLQVQVSEDLPYVYVDATLIELVLTNLLLSAVRLSPPAAPVVICGEVKDKQVVASVICQCPPIPPEGLARVLEGFYQVPGRQRHGMGLSLAVAKAIVEIHGGYLEAVNWAQGGVALSLMLPVERPV